MDPQSRRSQLLTLPGAIIIAGALIAIAIIWTKKPAPAPTQSGTQSNLQANSTAQLPEVNMEPVTSADHILGNPDADVKIVEYSDPSCPFCKMFNPTMEKIMADYGASGKVAWIYRHFPIDKLGSRPDGGILHPNAGREAMGLECAAALGGNVKFWEFEKKWYETIPDDGAADTVEADQAMLISVAKNSGIAVKDFTDCLSSGKFKDKIEKQYQDGGTAMLAISREQRGTPYSVIVTPDGKMIPIPGAQPYNNIKSVIEALLSGNK